MYHVLDWINSRRQSSAGVRPRYNIVSDSDYYVKSFATRSIKPVANKRMIARIYALLARIKETNDISISKRENYCCCCLITSWYVRKRH